VDTGLFRPLPPDEARARIGVRREGRLVLFVGNERRPEKRLDLARRVMDLVQQTMPASLLVADGVAHEEMPHYMNAADALLITSRAEGSPAVVREALACNLPVVSTDVGDVRRWIEGVEGCCICATGAPGELASALGEVLRHGGRCAGRQVAERGSEAATAERIELVYRRVLQNGGRAEVSR
jgi:glycosyltransferase involved in cell wall biosynthesis